MNILKINKLRHRLTAVSNQTGCLPECFINVNRESLVLIVVLWSFQLHQLALN